MRRNPGINHSILAENLRHLPLIVGITAFMFGLHLFSLFVLEEPLSNAFTLESILTDLNFLLVPLCAVNTIYIFQKWLDLPHQNKRRGILIKTGGLIIGTFIGTFIIEYASYVNGIVDDDYLTFGGFQASPYVTNILSNQLIALVIGLPIFVRQSKRHEVLYELKAKENELIQLQQLMTQTELETLQAKINPHFLYNSLNSIASLIHENPDKAERMVLSLSDLFRYSINKTGSSFSTIEEELNMIKTYLDIEKVRFEDQLTFNINVDEDCMDIRIPRFLIQPLVENAIKHGTSKIKQGIIELNIFREKDLLTIRLHDNGPDFPKELGSGYGIKSTYDKLKLLFPGSHSINFKNGEDKKVEIKLNNTSLQNAAV